MFAHGFARARCSNWVHDYLATNCFSGLKCSICVPTHRPAVFAAVSSGLAANLPDVLSYKASPRQGSVFTQLKGKFMKRYAKKYLLPNGKAKVNADKKLGSNYRPLCQSLSIRASRLHSS